MRDFAELGAAAPSLRVPAAEQDAFTTLDWFVNLRDEAFARDAQTRLYLWRSGAGAACLPMVGQADPASRALTLSALANYYSSLYGPIADAGVAITPELCAALAGAFADTRPRFDAVDIHPLDADAPFVRCMSDALRESGFAVFRYFCFGNWYLPVRGMDFAAYYASRPSRLRNTVERKHRALARRGGVSIDIVREPGEVLERAVDAFVAVYMRSWKKPEPHPGFVPGLCRRFAQRGWLRLGIVRVDDLPVAAQVWLVKDGRAKIFKLAHDEAHASLSAGSVLTRVMLEHALDVDRVVEVDYLTGDDDYKRDWMTDRRERVGLAAFNRRTARGVILAARQMGGAARRWLAPRNSRSPPRAKAR